MRHVGAVLVLAWATHALASVIVDDPDEGLGRGIRLANICRDIAERVEFDAETYCPQIARQWFEREFPGIKLEWPSCGDQRKAEALVLMAVHDRGGVDMYLRRLRDLCKG